MKKLRVPALMFIVALAMPCAVPAQSQKAAPAARKQAAIPAGVPKDAVPAGDHKWRWKDKDGKTWIFTKTPFSVVKQEESALKAAAAEAADVDSSNELSGAQIFDEGDSLRFVTKTPFGTREWHRKKTDLTAGEKAAWEKKTKVATSDGGAKS